MKLFAILLLAGLFQGCATTSRKNLDGEWKFDAEKTAELLRKPKRISPELSAYVARNFYTPHTFFIEGSRYRMVKGKEVLAGDIRVRRLWNGAFDVVMTCDKTPPGDHAVVRLTNFGFSYASRNPMFRGEQTAYVPVTDGKSVADIAR